MSNPPSELFDIGRFIRARRLAADATRHPLPSRRRHVDHLTQSELAELVGVSTVVISQIEQGRYTNLNEPLLHRIGKVLEFNIQDNAFATGLLTPAPRDQRTPDPAPDWLLDSVTDTLHPVLLFDPAYAILGINQAATAMLGEAAEPFVAAGNAVYAFFDLPHFRTLFPNWEAYASSFPSGMRMAYGVHPRYRAYITSVARQLSARNDFFRRMWEADDPLMVPSVEQELHHPTLGTLRLFQVVTSVVAQPDLTLVEFLPADEETNARLRQKD